MRKIIISIVLVIFLTPMLYGCGFFLLGAAAGGAVGYIEATDERPMTVIARDSVLTTKVKTALIMDGEVKARNINVDTDNYVIKLYGIVGSEAEKQKAIRVAESVNGVVRVESYLDIVP